MANLVTGGIQAVSVRHEAGFVFLIVNGKKILDCPPEVARQIAAAFAHQAGKAEEFLNPERAIEDQAILIRSGIPIRTATNPGMLREAVKESQHSPRLRRYISGRRARGVPSAEKLGLPKISTEPAPGN